MAANKLLLAAMALLLSSAPCCDARVSKEEFEHGFRHGERRSVVAKNLPGRPLMIYNPDTLLLHHTEDRAHAKLKTRFRQDSTIAQQQIVFEESSKSHYLVRVKHPAPPDMLSQLKATSGDKFVQYIPYDTYVVAMEPSRKLRVASMKHRNSKSQTKQDKYGQDKEKGAPAGPDESVFLEAAISVHPDQMSLTNMLRLLENAFSTRSGKIAQVWAKTSNMLTIETNAQNVGKVVEILANQASVKWMEKRTEYRTFNKYSSLIVQGTYQWQPTKTKLEQLGLNGKGQTVGIADTGIDFDSCFFYDPEVQCMETDSFMYDKDDFLVVFAAGNSGPDHFSIGSPGNAKNILSVGSSLNSRESYVAHGYGTYFNLSMLLSDGSDERLVDILPASFGAPLTPDTRAVNASIVGQYFYSGCYPPGPWCKDIQTLLCLPRPDSSSFCSVQTSSDAEISTSWSDMHTVESLGNVQSSINFQDYQTCDVSGSDMSMTTCSLSMYVDRTSGGDVDLMIQVPLSYWMGSNSVTNVRGITVAGDYVPMDFSVSGSQSCGQSISTTYRIPSDVSGSIQIVVDYDRSISNQFYCSFNWFGVTFTMISHATTSWDILYDSSISEMYNYHYYSSSKMHIELKTEVDFCIFGENARNRTYLTGGSIAFGSSLDALSSQFIFNNDYEATPLFMVGKKVQDNGVNGYTVYVKTYYPQGSCNQESQVTLYENSSIVYTIISAVTTSYDDSFSLSKQGYTIFSNPLEINKTVTLTGFSNPLSGYFRGFFKGNMIISPFMGYCDEVLMAWNAQNMGASALILYEPAIQYPAPVLKATGGPNEMLKDQITIPVAGISATAGAAAIVRQYFEEGYHVSFLDMRSNPQLDLEIYTCANSDCSQWNYDGSISGSHMNLWLPDAQMYNSAFRANVSKRYENEVAPGATCASFSISDSNNGMSEIELAVIPTHLLPTVCEELNGDSSSSTSMKFNGSSTASQYDSVACDRLELSSQGEIQVLPNEFQVFRGRSLTLNYFSTVNNRTSSPFPFELSWGGKSKPMCGNGLRDWTFRRLTAVNCTSTTSYSYTSTMADGMGGVYSQSLTMSTCDVDFRPAINSSGPMYLLVDMDSTSLYEGSIMNVTLNGVSIPFSSPYQMSPTCGMKVPIVFSQVPPNVEGPKFSLQINIESPKCWYCSSPSCLYINAEAFLAAPDVFEQCDDGNQVDGDGCSSTCTIEPGASCDSSFSIGSLQRGPDVCLGKGKAGTRCRFDVLCSTKMRIIVLGSALVQ
ncbi:hypothetical protein GUITHDRAFT_137786 [Guillardia theta CCMP2712]|uniref:Uncharacterized protein n=1 Tax=Guillardia theta (strain CCMP2712) TaxID=905079 RepID=L1JGI0_GUITC|nr:hypothetical protein GUITHDRAFT_137786 [Guillardia theta CCMP2712]EKX47200.1 hypothetical protein GUITHDRAFT_137786 [Guillardia theta CCMP2712]|eukprot:XP_005834180.1 hypothetical protein GUITHDRAFT_137786 [Guillardia theta CCMP2712]